MIRKLCSLGFVLAFALCVFGCAENEYKTTQKTETQSESTPQDVSPGVDIVD